MPAGCIVVLGAAVSYVQHAGFGFSIEMFFSRSSAPGIVFCRVPRQVYVKRGNLLYLTPRPNAKVSLAAWEKEVGEKLAKMQAIASAQPTGVQTQTFL